MACRRALIVGLAIASVVVAACTTGSEVPSASPSGSVAPASGGPLSFPDDPIGNIDQPDECTRVAGRTVQVSGWAIDRNAKTGTGIDSVSIFLDGGPDKGVPLGVAQYGNTHGAGPQNGGDARFLRSGWTHSWTAAGSPLAHSFTAVLTSSVTGRTKTLTRVIGRLRPCFYEPIGSIDDPPEGTALTGGTVALRGWAVDRDAVTGPGIASVELSLDGCPDAGIPLGRARYGEPSDGIATYFSTPEFALAGWSYRLNTGLLSPSPHDVYAVVRSSVHAHSTTFVRALGGPPHGFVGCFDEPLGGVIVVGELVNLSGWAIDRDASPKSGVASVTLSLEDVPGKPTPLGIASAGTPRPDVAMWPAAETSGWKYVWDSVGVPRGRHTIKAVVAGDGGKTATFTRSLELAPLFGGNMARRRAASASREMTAASGAAFAFDSDENTIWNSGDYAPQSIEVDLGAPIAIERIRLLVAQLPAGRTVHRVLGRSAGGSYRELTRFEGVTSDGQALEWRPAVPVTGIQFVRVETSESPSWIAWREIEVYLGSLAAASRTRVTGRVLLATGAPAVGACVQIGRAAACPTETDAEGRFFYDFDAGALAGADFTFVYTIEGVEKGSQALPKGAAAGTEYALPTYTLRP